MVGSNYIWAWENNRIVREILGRNGGQVVGERYLPIDEIDLAEIVDLILRHRPDFIFSTLIGESASASSAVCAKSAVRWAWSRFVTIAAR